LTIKIPEANIEKQVRTDEMGSAEVEFTADLEKWSPKTPKLYDVIFAMSEDVIEDHIGFRTIRQEGGEILLNGESIFLRGICIHESRPFGGGRANNSADAEVLLGWVKEMNGNYVRLAHYPHNEHMVRMADKMGILVWSEVPVYWTIQFENPEVYANAERQLKEMVDRDHNRASVILWSLANETPRSEARFTFLSNLAEVVRELDSTRLVTAALETQSRGEGVIGIHDPMEEVVDVIGVNSYCGWYGNMPSEQCSDLRWESDSNKPVILSEFGGGALQGYYGDENERWTEEFQAAVYKSNLEMIDNISFVRGTSPWLLKDFRSPRRPLPRFQDFWNRKGVISDEGLKKKAFFTIQDWYEKKLQEWE
jgi:beta-glucuronidase